MRLKITFFFAISLLCLNQLKSQIIWGAGSSDPVADSIGTFACPFGSPNGWTSVGGVNNAFYVRTTTGVSQGAYWGTQPPINSPTMSNGVALFDSDYMDNAGVQGNFGQGVSASPHGATLFSPFFDLTGFADSAVAMEFYLYYRDFDIVTMTVGISTDSGSTWTDFSFDQNVGANNVYPAQWVTINMPNVLDNQTNLTNCQLRFILHMDYYYVMFDEVRLIASCPVMDTAVTMVNETLSSPAQAPGVTYQWVTCPNYTPAPGMSTDSVYTATTNGDYAVILSYGLCSDTSACYTILSTGSNDLSATSFKCYPNPSNGTVTIQVREYSICTITDQAGREVKTVILNGADNATSTFENLAAGTYLVTVRTNTTVSTKRLVVQ